ncbi:MAG: hypothetical protein GX278_05505 [Aeromonadales bacterium]|nr:hypothetical protein [Aeromonadales bacterium]
MFKEILLNSRLISLLVAFSNCSVGCALGFYYGHFTCSTFVIALSIIFAGIGIQALCNYSLDYSRAYRKHRKEKNEGIVSPIMIGEISLTGLRKRMAIVTLLTTIFGGIAIYLSMGSNIQTLSWFIFICVICVLLTLVFSFTTKTIYDGISAHTIFFVFAMSSIVGSQLMIVCSSKYVTDIYPDTYFLGFSTALSSLMILFVSEMRYYKPEKAALKKSFTKLLKYEISTVYLIGVFVASLFFSVLACTTSHRAVEAILIIIGYLPMISLLYNILKYKNKTNKLKLRFNLLMLCCCLIDFIWVLILIVDYWLYL